LLANCWQSQGEVTNASRGRPAGKVVLAGELVLRLA
jgi:hypothetical protein